MVCRIPLGMPLRLHWSAWRPATRLRKATRRTAMGPWKSTPDDPPWLDADELPEGAGAGGATGAGPFVGRGVVGCGCDVAAVRGSRPGCIEPMGSAVGSAYPVPAGTTLDVWGAMPAAAGTALTWGVRAPGAASSPGSTGAIPAGGAAGATMVGPGRSTPGTGFGAGLPGNGLHGVGCPGVVMTPG